MRFRRLLSLALATGVIVLAACGSNNTTNNKNNAGGGKATQPAASSAAGTTGGQVTAQPVQATPTSLRTAAPTTAATTAAATPGASVVTGSITVYAALTQANADALKAAYEKAYPGATVNFYAAGTGAIVSKVAAEERAGGIQADVLFLADPTAMQDFVNDNRIEKYTPAGAQGLPQGTVDPNGYYTGVLIFNNVIIWNTKSGTPKPADWTDLTKSAYQGKIEIGDPSYSGTTFIQVAALSKKYGFDFFKQLKQNGAVVTQSTNTVGNDVASGQYTVGITLDSVARPLVQKGSPVEMIWPASGAVPVPAPVGIVKGTKHEEGARQFIEWLLSDDGQKTLISLGYTPVRPALAASVYPANVPPPLPVDLKAALDQKQQLLDSFSQIFPH
jgi:iron(III) transport system substrate-binding protein